MTVQKDHRNRHTVKAVCYFYDCGNLVISEYLSSTNKKSNYSVNEFPLILICGIRLFMLYSLYLKK